MTAQGQPRSLAALPQHRRGVKGVLLGKGGAHHALAVRLGGVGGLMVCGLCEKVMSHHHSKAPGSTQVHPR